MRIAVSGTHRVGKSSLVDELGRRLVGYECVAEPYELMVEDGFVFAHLPSVDDFEAQLRCSLELLEEQRCDVIFDRCPVEFLGYLMAHPEGGLSSLDEWRDRIRDATATLDLLVFVPVEGGTDDEWERFRVAELLRELVVGDSLRFAVPVLEVAGSTPDRARQVLGRLELL